MTAPTQSSYFAPRRLGHVNLWVDDSFLNQAQIDAEYNPVIGLDDPAQYGRRYAEQSRLARGLAQDAQSAHVQIAACTVAGLQRM